MLALVLKIPKVQYGERKYYKLSFSTTSLSSDAAPQETELLKITVKPTANR